MQGPLQLGLSLLDRNWGGARRGAGRPRKTPLPELNGKPGVPHLARPRVSPHHPVHVTLRVRSGVGNLRGHTRTRLLERAFLAARRRYGMRIVHWSIQGNHLHLVVEVESREALARGMQVFSNVVARRLNKLAGRHGKVFVDRYHAHVLRSPREVRSAVRYVLANFFLHAGVDDVRGLVDFHSSAFWSDAPDDLRPCVPARTWLLRANTA